MAETKYTDNVVIEGSDETKVQLAVQGDTSQEKALQTWEDDIDTRLAQVSKEGYVQVGDDLDDALANALIEAQRDEDSTAKPKRGLNLIGRIKDTLNTTVSWVAQELQLVGSSGVDAQHTAVRGRLNNDNTGAMTANAELRGGDFEVTNKAADATPREGTAIGVRAAVTNQSSGYIKDMMGVQIELNNENTATDPIDNTYGLKIEDVEDATNNYAIHTGLGEVQFGDAVGIGTVAGPTASAILDLESTTQGALFPRMTEAQRDAITAVQGLIVYNTDTDSLNIYDGSNWNEVGNSGILPHEQGGLEADVSGYNGLLKISSGATSQVTAPSGVIVGTTDTQTLSNKTLSAPAISDFSNAAHSHQDAAGGGTLSAAAIGSGTLKHERGGLEANVSGYNGLLKISGGATSQVTAPSGAIVGTTDTQTLSNKTLSAPNYSGNGGGQLNIDNLRLDGNTISSTNTNGDIYLMPNGSGEVGIGTTSPSYKLDVNGHARTRGLHIIYRNSDEQLRLQRNGSGSPYASWYINNDRSAYIQLVNGSKEFRIRAEDGPLTLWTTSERMRILANGRVGIGTTNPDTPLHVSAGEGIRIGNSGQYIDVRANGTGCDVQANKTLHLNYGNGQLVHVGQSSGSGLRFQVSGNSYLTGTVGIGIASPAYKLDVAGTVQATGWQTASDSRFKDNVTPMVNILERVRQLEGITFSWNDLHRNKLRRSLDVVDTQIGFVAQDVEKIFPEVIGTWEDSYWDDSIKEEDRVDENKTVVSDFRGIDYSRMVVLTVEAIKELADEVDALKSERRA